ncbi:preprotein translocase subunit YajC [Streptomyces sp. 6N223]|uniref:preprotein translocase subunit YajC n=1 Tax=Streptomyces sp. 6N223 TaxID=3457412 RepID=UPI003FD47299
MDIAIFFPFLLLIGVMYLMTRSAKNRQRQALQMRDSMEPGAGVRTIGGLYGLVKEVREDTVVLEIEPGVHAVYAKNAVGAVLDADEYRRIISGEPEPDPDEDAPVVPDDASSLTEAEQDAAEGAEDDDPVIKLDKPGADDEPADTPRNAKAEGENGSKS